MTRGRSLAALSLLAVLLVCGMAGAVRGPGGAGVRIHRGGAQAGLRAVTVFGGRETEQVPARDHGLRRRDPRLRRRRLARHLPRQRHDARGLPEGQEPRPATSIATGATARFEDVTARRGPRPAAAGDRAPARATTTTTATTICSSPTGARTACTTTAATARSRTSPRGPGSTSHAHALGHGLRLPRLRPRRPAGSLRRQLHRLRSRDRADARIGPVPLQGPAGRLRPARPARRQERALPQPRRRHVRGRVRAAPASPGAAAPTASASARSTSTTTAGPTSTSPTTRTRARSTATTTTAPSPTSASRPAAPTARTASRRRAWASPSATTTATARSTSSRPTSPATRRRSTPTPATASARTGPSRPASASTRAGSAGARLRRLRQRRLARHLPRQRPRLSGGRAAHDRGRLQAAQGRLPQPGQRPLRGRQRALGPPVTTPKAGRGAAFGDFDNDGDVDVVVNNVHDTPDLFRTRRAGTTHHWLLLKLVGTRSNRSAIGARVRVRDRRRRRRSQEVRGGGSYISQNDLRVHFGLGATPRASSGSRCAGRTGSRRCGRTSRPTASSRSKEGSGTPWRCVAEQRCALAALLLALAAARIAEATPIAAGRRRRRRWREARR